MRASCRNRNGSYEAVVQRKAASRLDMKILEEAAGTGPREVISSRDSVFLTPHPATRREQVVQVVLRGLAPPDGGTGGWDRACQYHLASAQYHLKGMFSLPVPPVPPVPPPASHHWHVTAHFALPAFGW